MLRVVKAFPLSGFCHFYMLLWISFLHSRDSPCNGSMISISMSAIDPRQLTKLLGSGAIINFLGSPSTSMNRYGFDPSLGSLNIVRV